MLKESQVTRLDTQTVHLFAATYKMTSMKNCCGQMKMRINTTNFNMT